MPATGNWLLVQRLVTIPVYKLLRFVFVTLQSIYWQLNGTAQKIHEARLPGNYKRSAQVLNVVRRFNFCESQTITVDNFLCTHNRFENPQYIIDNENITLMTINEDNAVFCETDKKGMHLWRSQYDAFIRYAQLKFCRRLIIVPLSTFYRLSEQIGDPKGELIFLFATSRCGSNLVTQVMENTGRCVAMSQPNSPNIVGREYAKFGDTPSVRQLARHVIRWECRPYPSIQPPPLAYLIKIDPPTAIALPMFRSLFPASRGLFMYRDVVKVAKSQYRYSLVHPSLRLLYVFGSLCREMSKMIMDFRGFNGSDFRERMYSDLTFGVMLYALTTKTYLDLRQRGFKVSAVRYEDLVASPLDVCRVILEHFGLPVSLAEHAIKAFNVDSHRNTISAKKVIGKFKEPQLTPTVKAKLNELLKRCGAPLIGEPCIVEGTLTSS